LKVVLLKVKSLLKVGSHYLKTMTRCIYISKMSVYLANSLSQKLCISHQTCVWRWNESRCLHL